MVIAIIVIIILSIIGIAVFGGSILNPIQNILFQAPVLIGLCAAGAGVWMLVSIYPKNGKDQDKYIGMGLIIVGALIGISGSFIDVIRILFGNALILILMIGGILLIEFKREGIIG